MMSRFAAVVATLFLCVSFPGADADAFLKHGGENGLVSLAVRSEELQAAMGAVMGCTAGGASDAGEARRTEVVRQQLLPVWRTLPKMPQDESRVEWRFVRYTAHRHFMHRFGIMVRGLEPQIQVNSSNAGEADVLSREAPALAKQLSGSSKHGFSLQDAAVMIAALEQLLFDSDSVVLEKAYRKKGLATTDLQSRQDLQKMMVDYMVYWMLGDDTEGAELLLGNRKLLDEHIPHWQAISAMVEGTVRALEFSRQRSPRPGAAHTTFQQRYSFEDALEVAGSIGRSFAFFWESQCQDIKTSLLALDNTGSGRVRLPDFYGANKDGEWRFGESEEYLRELGALDETSSWRGKQVIVSNYMQAVSNCIVTRPHYLVCCINECEEMMGYIEEAIGAPVGLVEDVMSIAETLTNGDDQRAKLDESLRSQLYKIAAAHGGQVPLHGRLFAQWLHYAFPSECPFPHLTGTAAARTPLQFGESFSVSEEAVAKHVAEEAISKDLKQASNVSTEQWQMSQWSEEEELLGDYSTQLRRPWYKRASLLVGGGSLVALLALLQTSTSGHQSAKKPSACDKPMVHFV